MTDSLRTRIAQVLFARNAGLDWDMQPRSWDGTDEDVRADWLADADAVIRELGMTEFRVEHPVAERWWATKVEPIDD